MRLTKSVLTAVFVASIATPAFAQTKTNEPVPCQNIVQVILGCPLWNFVLAPTVTTHSSYQPWATRAYPGAVRPLSEEGGSGSGGDGGGSGGSGAGAK